ncbi:hypothetical protein BCR41DRAFT_373190 [Lobosporangium transversale]|uniref:Uncharacterized protein n=1 Tax=Lobosporangium transversale TaxID=64571 RepID=A0A1Y2GEA6_9FUNG|nr:hypothetical protein BCR41DRAFT_373190 [Lobosporangium transversale]ORZ08486.1 hypothetical protein BCR41DRAFT_373190 [Lobosporangium transversale]|eukprot:XP_021878414.1 hypothetical protein BCR41DRAFT_373190 [Lobosporangium transversale]
MCHAEGPTQSITNCAMMTIANPKFSTIFRQYQDSDFIDEEEVEDAEDLDADFSPALRQEYSPSMVCTVLRNRTIQKVPHDGYSSPDTSSCKKKDPTVVLGLSRDFFELTKDILTRPQGKEEREELDKLYDHIEACMDRRAIRNEETEHRRNPSLLSRLRACLDGDSSSKE